MKGTSAINSWLLAAAFLGKDVFGRLATDTTLSPTMVATSGDSQITLTGEFALENATQIPEDETALPSETVSPSDMLETPSPSAVDSLEDFMIMNDNELDTVFLESIETDAPSSFWNETNMTDVPVDIDADENSGMSPPVMLIEVEPETTAPSSIQQWVSPSPTDNSEEAESVAAVITSHALNRCFSASIVSGMAIFILSSLT